MIKQRLNRLKDELEETLLSVSTIPPHPRHNEAVFERGFPQSTHSLSICRFKDGQPQKGQSKALSEISCLQSVHSTNAIKTSLHSLNNQVINGRYINTKKSQSKRI